MINIFYKIEEVILEKDDIIFDENLIEDYILKAIVQKMGEVDGAKRGFYFEKIIYDFFEYMNISLIKTPKTRDFGIDGIIKMNLQLFGEVNLGVSIKYSLIDFGDVDMFLTALRNSELNLGVVVCKDSRNLEKYEFNSKIKAILFSRGIFIKGFAYKLILQSFKITQSPMVMDNNSCTNLRKFGTKLQFCNNSESPFKARMKTFSVASLMIFD